MVPKHGRLDTHKIVEQQLCCLHQLESQAISACEESRERRIHSQAYADTDISDIGSRAAPPSTPE